MSLAVHPLGEIMKITGTAILRDYHRANDFQVAAEVTDSGSTEPHLIYLKYTQFIHYIKLKLNISYNCLILYGQF